MGLVRLFFICFLFSFLIIPGCRGKEEKQTLVTPPEVQQQEKGKQSVAQGVTPSVTSSVSPEVLGDTPPKVTSLKISPETPVVGDKVRAVVETSDKEGATVTVEYNWFKNGEQLRETSDTLTITGDFKHGDKITLATVPDDGKRKGNPMSVNFFVANSLPKIQPSDETFRFDGRLYSYQIKATDPDGDPLTYSLKSAPQGMTINNKGLIQWNVPPDFKGTAHVTVSVSDGHGGQTLQAFTIDIRATTKK